MVSTVAVDHRNHQVDRYSVESSPVSVEQHVNSVAKTGQDDRRILCKTCDRPNFTRLFRSEALFKSTSSQSVEARGPPLFIWNFEKVRTNTSCSFCGMLYDIVIKNLKEEQIKLLSSLWGSIVYSDSSLYTHAAIDIEFRLQDRSVINGPRILPHNDSNDNDPWNGRSMNTIHIDQKLVRSWLELCESQHGNYCTASGWEFPFKLLVIDVKRGCVVEAPQNCRYLALSYVWGSLKQPLLTTKTYSELRTDGGISNNQHIPRTIKDAMLLCTLLGECYLWVDSLCIVQDDDEIKRVQISNMNLVYSSSVMTIVAAVGSDSNAGLAGLVQSSEPRATQQSYGNIGSQRLVTASGNIVDTVLKSYWNSRGWTLQERLLSKRLLVFSDCQVFFCCNQALWREDMCLEFCPPSDESSNQRDRMLPILGDSKQVFKVLKSEKQTWALALSTYVSYIYVVEDYTKRNLSHAQDVLNAFTGIAAAFSKALGGFHWGLPLEYISLSLLFDYRSRTVQSGTSPGSQKSNSLRRKDFPSWSWVGWSCGQVDYQRASELVQQFNHPADYSDDLDELEGFQGPPTRSVLAGPEWLCLDGTTIRSLATGVQDSTLLDLPSKLQEQWAPQAVSWSDVPFFQQHNFQPTHLLLCWTGVVSAFTDSRYINLKVVDPTQGRSNLWIENIWVGVLPNTMEIIAVGYSTVNSLVFLMLVHWVDGIAYRLKIVDWPMHIDDWILENPRRKLIVLG
ncbi:hypothetical protein BP6252_13854 [Coleophoma cylindrospora]|uniref:Heterokaryon incompatibility domain-containing protein n=1 Tax=Coleophoma cylindrospora TaxID=1849047 RepID=A0A3D8Q638_9HELO|nr:hypothetical protein BP6252_13854 [Coleophoma cylindrospora]